MQFHHGQQTGSLPIPGDNHVLDKDDPLQEIQRLKAGLPSRFEKPDYLTDAEWEQIKIDPSEIRELPPEWDGKCQGDCCKEEDRDLV